MDIRSWENEEYDIIEFSIDDSVEVEHDIDNILDFINTFAPELKKQIISILEEPGDDTKDKAVFMISKEIENTKEVYYIILIKIITLEKDNGLMMIYSKNVDLISLYMSNLTTMSYEKVKKSFIEKSGNDLEDKV